MTEPERILLRQRIATEKWCRLEVRRAEAQLWRDDKALLDLERDYQDPAEVCDLELADVLAESRAALDRKRARRLERMMVPG